MKHGRWSWVSMGWGVLLVGCTLSPKGAQAPQHHLARSVETLEAGAVPSPVLSEMPPLVQADTSSVAQRIRDRALATQIMLALSNVSALRAYLPTVVVQNGALVLRGTVPTEQLRQQILQIVDRIADVARVVDELVVETPRKTSPLPAYHTVRPGETLWDIARRYGLSITQLRRLNDLRTNIIRPGQRLRVR
ncbi:MAG: LysM peptidoglycan-binding domain-containing protein [Rhodothermus sp.]|nr:LysM peptidoglycan-binding domain-containing protein [Rhodothermus sp.]